MSFKVCQVYDTQQFWIVGEKREREGYGGALASMENDFLKRGEAQSAICEIRKSAKEVWAP